MPINYEKLPDALFWILWEREAQSLLDDIERQEKRQAEKAAKHALKLARIAARRTSRALPKKFPHYEKRLQRQAEIRPVADPNTQAPD